MRRNREALAAFLIGFLGVIPTAVLGVSSGLLAGLLMGLLAIPIVAVVAAVVLLGVKVGRRSSLGRANAAMFLLDAGSAFVAAALGLVGLGPTVGHLLGR